MTRTFPHVVLSLAIAAPLFAGTARAHISLERGGTHLSRYGDGTLKEAPCGQAGGTRGAHVYTYAPGQTVDVSIVEYIPHTSYFRLAFDQNGDDGFKDPASIQPIDPARLCPDGPGDHCGASDFYNTPEVLPDMDNLNPHIATLADLTNPPKYTWHVTLPNVECDNCTLQVIQVMEDDGAHGPYDPTPGVGVADIYHQCIDIVLKAGTVSGGAGGQTGGGGASATSTGGMTGNPVGDGSTTTGAGGSGTGPASSGDSGGCTVSSFPHGPNGPSSLLLAGLLLSGRRLRRQKG